MPAATVAGVFAFSRIHTIPAQTAIAAYTTVRA